MSRGYIGVGLHDVDQDLQRSLQLGNATGALVEDVTPGTPGERAGLKRYDLITAVDGRRVVSTEELIRDVAARVPGTPDHASRPARRSRIGGAGATGRTAAAREATNWRPRRRSTATPRGPRHDGIGLAVEDLTRQVGHPVQAARRRSSACWCRRWIRSARPTRPNSSTAT